MGENEAVLGVIYVTKTQMGMETGTDRYMELPVVLEWHFIVSRPNGII